MTALLGISIAVAVGIGYAALARRIAARPSVWHWPALAAYVIASLPVLLPDVGFIIAGVVALLGIGLSARRVSHPLALLGAAVLLVSPLLIFRFTTLPIPNVFSSP